MGEDDGAHGLGPERFELGARFLHGQRAKVVFGLGVAFKPEANTAKTHVREHALVGFTGARVFPGDRGAGFQAIELGSVHRSPSFSWSIRAATLTMRCLPTRVVGK